MGINKSLRVIGLFFFVCCLAGCGGQGPLSAEETFNRALAGLSGVDNFSFRGEAVIREEQNGPFMESLVFEGKLQRHTNLTLSARNTPKKISNDKVATESLYKQDGVTVELKRKDGKWSMLPSKHVEDVWMTQLNPLQLLESVGKLEKTVTRELGAARGTKMLRIELSPEAAATVAQQSLEEQMKALAERIDRVGDPLYSDDPKVRKQLKALWEQDYADMESMLKQADTVSIFHMTINKKSHLPTRVSMERTFSFVDEQGQARTETLLSDVTFAGY